MRLTAVVDPRTRKMTAKRVSAAPKEFTLKDREFRIGAWYEFKGGGRVRITGHGQTVVVIRRHGCLEFCCAPSDLGAEVSSHDVIDLACVVLPEVAP